MSLKTRLYFTGIVTLSIWTLLLWNYYHGGVPSHHILARKDLPEISNWWGGLLLPLLTCFLLYRTDKRISRQQEAHANTSAYLKKVIYGFVGALCFGAMLSAFFTFDYPEICGYMILAVFPLSLLLPIYRAECILGFVIGMTFTFGAVLPAAIGCILTLSAAGLYLFIRPGIRYILSKISNKAPAGK